MGGALYLHGFASTPASAKGRFFASRLAEIGCPIRLPDLAEGDFHGLTISRQLELVRRDAQAMQPDVIIGSSLGGYLAALWAAERPEDPTPLALLAPAFGFPRRWAERLGPARLERWRRRDRLEVFHYGEARMDAVGWNFYQDALAFPDFPDVQQPALILHGRRDEAVPVTLSEEFARDRPNVRLEALDSDHALMDVLETIWDQTYNFMKSCEPAGAAEA